MLEIGKKENWLGALWCQSESFGKKEFFLCTEVTRWSLSFSGGYGSSREKHMDEIRRRWHWCPDDGHHEAYETRVEKPEIGWCAVF